MSFYVTLPSNSSRDVFPNNTMTKFSTKLKNAIRLEGSYEVALVELMYPVSWKYRLDGAIIVKYNDITVSCEIKFYAYETLSELVAGINEYFQSSDIQLEIGYNSRTQKVYFILPAGVKLQFISGVEKEFGFKLREYVGIENVIHSSDRKVRNMLNPIESLYI